LKWKDFQKNKFDRLIDHSSQKQLHRFVFLLSSYTKSIMSVERPVGERPLGRSRRRWDDNIRKDLKCDGELWTGPGYGQR